MELKSTTPYESYDIADIYVPEESVPRRKTLTPTGQRQVKEAIEKLIDDTGHNAVLESLKGISVGSNYYRVKYRYHFERFWEERSMSFLHKDQKIDDVVKAAKRRKYWIAEQINAECEFSKV
jgi:hypothetical protein